MSVKGCGLWLWHSLDFSLTFVVVTLIERAFVKICWFVHIFCHLQTEMSSHPYGHGRDTVCLYPDWKLSLYCQRLLSRHCNFTSSCHHWLVTKVKDGYEIVQFLFRGWRVKVKARRLIFYMQNHFQRIDAKHISHIRNKACINISSETAVIIMCQYRRMYWTLWSQEMQPEV